MQKDSSIFQIPSYARKEAYDFSASDNSMQVFVELNKIAEEIEACRLSKI